MAKSSNPTISVADVHFGINANVEKVEISPVSRTFVPSTVKLVSPVRWIVDSRQNLPLKSWIWDLGSIDGRMWPLIRMNLGTKEMWRLEIQRRGGWVVNLTWADPWKVIPRMVSLRMVQVNYLDKNGWGERFEIGFENCSGNLIEPALGRSLSPESSVCVRKRRWVQSIFDDHSG